MKPQGYNTMSDVIDFTSKRNEAIDKRRNEIATRISDIASLVINVAVSTILTGDEATVKTVLDKAHKTFAGICDDLNNNTIAGAPQITIEQLFTAAPLKAFTIAAIASMDTDKNLALVQEFATACGYRQQTIDKLRL